MRWLLGSRRDRRVGDELRFHRDRLIDDYIAAGMDRQAAERRVFLEFGNVVQIEEACRDVRGRWLDDLTSDLRYTLRTLARNPAFAAVAVLSLALGIGANAAIFSLVNAVMLRTLPVSEPGRLVQITRLRDGQQYRLSYPLFEHLRGHTTTIAGIFAQAAGETAIVLDGESEFVTTDLVSGGYFSVVAIDAAAGRLLEPADDTLSAAAPAAVISDRYWQRRFGRSPAAIGKTFAIRDRTFTIVGVTPASYQSAAPGRVPDLILPLALMMRGPQYADAGFNWLSVLARLKPDATVEQANAEVQVLFGGFVQAQAARTRDKERDDVLHQRIAVLAAPDGFNPLRYDHGSSLLILMGIVALVLLLACVNLSGLLLARAAARQREISIRLAIGASRGRLVRQFLTESLVLAALGGAAGLAVAGWFSDRLFLLFVNGREIALSVAPDWRVLAFTCVVSLLACCIAGLIPALHAVRVSVNPALKEVRAQGHRRLGKAFVIAQLAMSMVLVVAATLFVGTLVKLYAVDRGFDTDGVIVVNVRASQPYPGPRAQAVQGALLDRLRAMPGVRSASAVRVLPIAGGLVDRAVQVEGYTFRSDEADTVGYNAIAPAYFATMRTPLLAGREFGDRDIATAPHVAIVNESFARYFFGDDPAMAIGRRVTSARVSLEIVGVVGDARYQDLRAGFIKTMYVPWMQAAIEPPSSYCFLARVSAGDPMRLAPGLDRLVRDADPALRVRSANAYAALVDQSIVTERIMAMLGGFFGVLALLVAALGMFGVLAFQVARRTNELGVRMALGASRRTMMGLVLRDVLVMVLAGGSIGTALALAVTGFARTTLFGLTPSDPRVFLIAAAVLTAAAMLAAWLPARRASRVDPLVALRHE
jgi:predicted permease